MVEDVFAALRRYRLVPQVAERMGLDLRGEYFVCPEDGCPSRKKSRRRRAAKVYDGGESWKCHACNLHGDVCDLIEAVRGCTKRDAVDEAKGYAGIDDRKGGPPPPPPPPPTPKPTPMGDADLAARRAALRSATAHYEAVRVDGREYLETLGMDGRDLDDTEKGRDLALYYLNRKRGLAPLAPMPVPLGIVPAWRTGLIERLTADGGADLVQAAERAGILRTTRRDGAKLRPFESFKGRLWLPWVDADGEVHNVKGRGVPDLAKLCGLEVDEHGALERPMLFLRTSESAESPAQMPKPRVPYGWGAALKLRTTPLFILEGEIDSLSALLAGFSAIGVGGSGGVGREFLRTLLDGWPAVVLYDGDPDPKTRAQVLEKAIGLARHLGCSYAMMPEGDINDVMAASGKRGVEAALLDAVHRSVKPEPEQKQEAEPKEGSKTKRPPDAKVGAGQPVGWGLRGNMLCKVTTSESGSETWEETGIRDPPKIAWRGRDVVDQTIVLGISGRLVGTNHEIEVALPRGVVASGREIVAPLASHGFGVDSTTANHMVRYLTDYEFEFADAIPFRHGASQFGWHGDSFLYGTECFGPSKLSYIGDQTVVTEALAAKGDHAVWLRDVLGVLELYPIALTAFYASLCGPVIAHVPDMSGFAVEFAGESSGGKSTVANAIASAWGDSSRNGGLMRQPKDTINGLEQHAVLMQSLPLFLEDTHLITPLDKARDVVMTWVNGIGKMRAKQSGRGVQEQRKWATTVILTGEDRISSSTPYAGVGARVLSFGVPLPRAEDGTDEEQEVIAHIQRMDRARVAHYGHAGRMWVEYLVGDGIRQVLEAYETWLDFFRLHASNDGPHQRWAKDLALIAAVAQVAPAVIGSDDESAKTVQHVGLQFLGSNRAPDTAREAMDWLLSWCGMEASSGASGDTGAPQAAARKTWFRVYDDGTIACASIEVEERMRSKGVTLDAVRGVWLKRGWLKWRGEAASFRKCRLGSSGLVSCIVIAPEIAEGFRPTPGSAAAPEGRAWGDQSWFQ